MTSLLENIRKSDIYKDMRKTFQDGMGINRDQFYAIKDPLKKLDKILAKSKLPESSLTDLEQRIRKIYGNTEDNWFNNITLRYLSLELSGYQEDEIKMAENKTFQNTIEDSFHIAFASQCDFYITNDKRNLRKAKAVYDSLCINTTVCTSDEFREFLARYISKEKDGSFLEDVIEKINDWRDGGYDPDNPKRITVYLKEFVLDYFNKAYHFSDLTTPDGKESWMIVLTKEKPTNGRYTIILDINMLIAKLNSIFGDSLENKYLLDKEEFATIQKGENWSGRSWNADQLFVQFKSIESYFQLYIYPTTLHDQ